MRSCFADTLKPWIAPLRACASPRAATARTSPPRTARSIGATHRRQAHARRAIGHNPCRSVPGCSYYPLGGPREGRPHRARLAL